MKGAELLLGRKPRGHWNSREIDLDLLYYGEIISSGRPTVPHPEVQKRQFVLIPLCDIAPEWKDPLTGCSLQEMLFELRRREGDLGFKIVDSEDF